MAIPFKMPAPAMPEAAVRRRALDIGHAVACRFFEITLGGGLVGPDGTIALSQLQLAALLAIAIEQNKNRTIV